MSYVYLQHHGIKGQKWGVRRFQNADGSLTAAGKKRISKEYKKVSEAAVRDYTKNYSDIYVTAHNRTANKMNDGEIDKFNKRQENKYGKDYAKRDGYEDDFEKLFSKKFVDCWNMTLAEFYDSNKNFKKAEELMNKYDMVKWDDLAQKNNEEIALFREYLNKR